MKVLLQGLGCKWFLKIGFKKSRAWVFSLQKGNLHLWICDGEPCVVFLVVSGNVSNMKEP